MSDDSGLRATDANGSAQTLEPVADRYQDSQSDHSGLHAARDSILERPVMLERASGEAVPELLHRARFLGRLNHTGIGPVLDFRSTSSESMVVFADVGGITLREAVLRGNRGEPVKELATPSACLVVFLKVCDIIAAAHEQRVVHHALAAEHIRLGEHGQVVVTGWATAMTVHATPAAKRFVRSSAASDERIPLDGLHEDIAAIGSCLFLALTGETPPLAADRTLGGLDVATRSRLPHGVDAVIRQALASSASHGYTSVDDLADDLQRIVGGLVPAATKAGNLALAWPWIRRHRTGLITAAALVLAGGIVVEAMSRTQRESRRLWGSPISEERFENSSWTSRWEPRIPETWAMSDGRILTTGLNESALIFKRRLTPPIAVEYSARISPGTRLGDLSLWWCEEPGLLANQRLRAYNAKGLLFQLGAFENTFACLTRMPAGKPIAMAALNLVAGRDYRVRVEIDDNTYRIFVDGTLLMQHADMLPAGSGHIALFGYFPGKSFDDVLVYERDIPPLVSPLAIGDGAFQDGHFPQAAAHYARVAEAGRQPLADQALFRQGLAERSAGDPYRSLETWKRIGDPQLRNLTECLTLVDLVDGGQQDQALERFRWFWKNRPDVRTALTTQWLELSTRVMTRTDLAMTERMHWFDLREELFADEPVTALSAAQMLMSAGRHAEVFQRFPADHRSSANALLSLGREEELLAKPWANSRERGQALYNLGRLDDIVGDTSLYVELQALALVKRGRFDEAMAQPWGRPWVLVHTGHAQEILDDEGVPTALQNAALMAAGRMQDAAGAGIANFRRSGGSEKAKLLLAGPAAAKDSADPIIACMAALAGGDQVKARAIRAAWKAESTAYREGYLSAGLVMPLLDQELGNPSALASALADAAKDQTPRWGGILRLVAAAARDAQAETELERTVWTTESAAWIAIARALRGELAGDRGAALANWRAYLALPAHQRMLSESEPHAALELCAAWRVEVLSRP